MVIKLKMDFNKSQKVHKKTGIWALNFQNAIIKWTEMLKYWKTRKNRPEMAQNFKHA